MWKTGPLPPNTYHWGGVVRIGDTASGFYFADFCGDHVKLCPSGEVLQPGEVAMYDNSLTLPPNVKGRCDETASDT